MGHLCKRCIFICIYKKRSALAINHPILVIKSDETEDFALPLPQKRKTEFLIKFISSEEAMHSSQKMIMRRNLREQPRHFLTLILHKNALKSEKNNNQKNIFSKDDVFVLYFLHFNKMKMYNDWVLSFSEHSHLLW